MIGYLIDQFSAAGRRRAAARAASGLFVDKGELTYFHCSRNADSCSVLAWQLLINQASAMNPQAIVQASSNKLKGSLALAIPLLANAWFSKPRHQNSVPTAIRKTNLETSMTKYTLLLQGTQEQSLHLKVTFLVPPKCPRIVPEPPKAPKWMHQA